MLTSDPRREKFRQVLSRYLPESAVEWAVDQIIQYRVIFRITRARHTKLGDYRHPFGSEGHRISVNHDLNPYAFLVTFAHEVAHLITYNKHQHRVQPHGAEWQTIFSGLLKQLIQLRAFPDEISTLLLHRGSTLAASSCTDTALMKALRKYDRPKGTVLVHELHLGDLFIMRNGDVFRVESKNRTRYRCFHLYKKQYYLVSGNAEVKPYQPDSDSVYYKPN
jgi:hypothetical protein